jgi:hypothetical protein
MALTEVVVVGQGVGVALIAGQAAGAAGLGLADGLAMPREPQAAVVFAAGGVGVPGGS